MTLVHMEKICIVRRKIPEAAPDHRMVRRTNFYTLRRSLSGKVDPSNSGPLRNRWAVQTLIDAPRQSNPGLSIELTPAQAELVRSHPYFRLLVRTVAEDSGIALSTGKDGKIVLNLQLTPFCRASMLTTQDVSDLLQVSKNFVSKLVKAGELKSYKLYRLRRFSLEDVLSFLSDSKESF